MSEERQAVREVRQMSGGFVAVRGTFVRLATYAPGPNAADVVCGGSPTLWVDHYCRWHVYTAAEWSERTQEPER